MMFASKLEAKLDDKFISFIHRKVESNLRFFARHADSLSLSLSLFLSRSLPAIGTILPPITFFVIAYKK